MPNIFQSVPTIIHGIGCRERLAESCLSLGERVLVVTGRGSMRRAGWLPGILQSLADVGLAAQAHEGVPAEPPLAAVDEARDAARDFRADVIVGLGGGSALDVAKSVAGLLKAPEAAEYYFHGGEITGYGAVPFIAMPGTFGTGTEVTPNAVLSDPEAKVKKSIRHDCLLATVALVDPEIGLSAPQAVKAASGMDALTQAIEGYLSIHATNITEPLSLRGVELLLANLARFVTADSAGDDALAAADACATGSLLAGMAFANSRLGMIHGVVHPLGIRYHEPHGKLCGIMLPYALRFNRDAIPEKYDRLSTLAGMDIVDFCASLLTRFDMPADLGYLDIDANEIPVIVEESLPSGSLKANPWQVDADNLTQLLVSLTGNNA